MEDDIYWVEPTIIAENIFFDYGHNVEYLQYCKLRPKFRKWVPTIDVT